MGISFPRTDIITGLFQQSPFKLYERQEYSRDGRGRPYVKSKGEAVWTAQFQTVPMTFQSSLEYAAKLNSLDGAIGTFYAYDKRRPYPKEYADGDFADSGKINTLNSNNKAMSLKSLPASFKLSVGDYLAFDFASGRRALHQIMESVTADGSGLTTEFEVRPHIRPGIVLSPDVAVTLKKPSAIFVIEPGTLQQSTENVIHDRYSFSAVQDA